MTIGAPLRMRDVDPSWSRCRGLRRLRVSISLRSPSRATGRGRAPRPRRRGGRMASRSASPTGPAVRRPHGSRPPSVSMRAKRAVYQSPSLGPGETTAAIASFPHQAASQMLLPRGTEPADGVLLQVIDPGTPPAVALRPGFHRRHPGRQVLRAVLVAAAPARPRSPPRVRPRRGGSGGRSVTNGCTPPSPSTGGVPRGIPRFRSRAGTAGSRPPCPGRTRKAICPPSGESLGAPVSVGGRRSAPGCRRSPAP